MEALMKKHVFTLGVLMICFSVPACSGQGDPSAPHLTVGGIISGLTGTLVLQNNGGDALTVRADGPFTFPTEMAPGGIYAVTVHANPETQTCLVSNGTGTVLISSVMSVSVDCFKQGALDLAFGSPSGFVVGNNAAGGNGDDFGNAVAIDRQGRILSAGGSMNSAGNTDMVLWRFNADGTIDTSFNQSGIVVHDSAAGGSGDDSANAMAIDPHENMLGNILVTGSSKSTAGNTDMVVWRFKDDGALDSGFNNSGIVSAAVGTGDHAGNALAIDSQGRIVVAGSSKTAAGTMNMAVWRFKANGAIDYSFSGDGVAVLSNAAGGNGDDSGNAVAVDSQGRIVVAGSSKNSAGNKDMVVWRFKNNGDLDTSFNSTGIFVHNNAAGGYGDDSGNAIAIDSQGMIVVAGSSTNSAGNTDMTVWRLKSEVTGSAVLDTSFNGTGFVIDNGAAGSNGDDSGRSVAIDSQGRILVTGTSTDSTGAATDTDMIVWRFKAGGSLDTMFAAYGIAAHDGAAGGAGDDSGRGIVIDSQGKIVVTGSSKNSAGNADMVIWRLYP
jgi:uncharacterized delta-60 repeat protein